MGEACGTPAAQPSVPILFGVLCCCAALCPGVTSAFEVEYTSTNNASDTMWLPVAIPEAKPRNFTNTLTVPILPAGVSASTNVHGVSG
eukprot:COSAG02_NODE_8106_length_2707_cov_29.223806_2_plen_88_part_00